MNTKEFDCIVFARCEKIKAILTLKAKEYARGGDRLHNFNTGERLSGMSRERVLYGFMLKHIVSFLDMLDDIDQKKIPTNAQVDEKIGDIINYFILLEASIKDRNTPKP